MRIKINGQKLRSLRNERSWSQSFLSQASGLSLRTIQRAEKGEMISLETLTALASVLEVETKQLKVAAPKTRLPWRLGSLIGVAALMGFSWFLLAGSAQAVSIEVDVRLKSKKAALSRFDHEDDKERRIQIKDETEISFVASRRENKTMMINVKVYDLRSGQRNLVSTPSVLTSDGNKTSPRVEGVQMSFTPRF